MKLSARHKQPEGLPEHLGGSIGMVHVDEGALKWAKTVYPTSKTFIDVGSGPGWQVDIAETLGLSGLGIDGDYTQNPDVIHDFTLGEPDIVKDEFDIGWSVEFLEHVEEQYVPNFMALFKKCNFIICSASPFPSPRHPNPQPQSYWYEVFAKWGLVYSEELTADMRAASTMERELTHTLRIHLSQSSLEPHILREHPVQYIRQARLLDVVPATVPDVSLNLITHVQP